MKKPVFLYKSSKSHVKYLRKAKTLKTLQISLKLKLLLKTQ